MKAFDFDQHVVGEYARFSRSFTKIQASDLSAAVDQAYQDGRFWPEPLLSLNPRYEKGPTVDDLVESGDLDEATGRIFRFGKTPLRFHRHQAQAIAKARAGHSYVVTTGTGSGKSLCFFVPIVDAIVRARRAGRRRGTSAIIIYPMNALANSQLNEITKFISGADLPADLRPVVKRYTGQENQTERSRIADEPPDILLTNFMMAELLLTRQDEIDKKVIGNASGLAFLVLDELHTYRGRQGADVAVLVRRLRERCTPDRPPICVGTSATMSNEGEEIDRAQAVSEVANRLFGAPIDRDSVIDEWLERRTDDTLGLADIRADLANAILSGLPGDMEETDLKRHPLAIWVELALGLDDRQKLRRRDPVPLGQAVARLAHDSGLSAEQCRPALLRLLTQVSAPGGAAGGSERQAFLAFKLHRFLSGAGEVFTTLEEAPRRVLFEGQMEDPEAPGTRLYPTRFCRTCGQEFHVVSRTQDSYGALYLPRNIDDVPVEDEAGEAGGYLTPAGTDEPDYAFTGDPSSLPEDWRDERNGADIIRSNRKSRIPVRETVNVDGRADSRGRHFWFIPGKFGFCTRCLEQPHSGMRERSKLAGLSGEGRSSATTVLVSSALEWMNSGKSNVPPTKRKLLGFTDNRQDAALQAGHFNDFLFVSLLRGAILRAVLDAGPDGLSEEAFGYRVAKALSFTKDHRENLVHWMREPDSGALPRENAQRALAKVLSHRVWTDLRRGWRYTNPNLTELGLIEARFVGVDEIASDAGRMGSVLSELGRIDGTARQKVLQVVLGAMLEGLAVDSESLDRVLLDGISQNSRSLLRAPWAMDQREAPRSRTTLLLQAPGKDVVGLREEQSIVRAGVGSRIGRLINRRSVIGARLKRDEYLAFMNGLFELLAREGLLMRVDLGDKLSGWRLQGSAIRLIPGAAAAQRGLSKNHFFQDHYLGVASQLKAGRSTYWGMEGREHTAQVGQKQREWREWRFRFEEDDRAAITANRDDMRLAGEADQFLPALFCSPTMELGVDISALNAVYLRNVPPTPANYAQRAGRAGRSGQAASIVTYCAAQSPHDQYFFRRRNDMVAGVVRPPALDITNEELVTSHLNAVWLAESGLALSPDIPEILDLSLAGYPMRDNIAAAIGRRDLVLSAQKQMHAIICQIVEAAAGRRPSWMASPQGVALALAEAAPAAFNRAFDRWRQLYGTAREQKAEADRGLETVGLANDDKKRLRALRRSAEDQIDLLESGRANNSSDFYTYRYLATEGFLPGYNFPRLPLYAFIPGEGSQGSFLQRARFLAISEFGPRSLIYHEGRAYRVVKAKLPPEARAAADTALATRDVHICASCGASHDEEGERCHACASPLAGAITIRGTLRIDNVEASPADRITANDEERVRQGFDIQTVFTWPVRSGRVAIEEREFHVAGTHILTLQYANGAEISRVNKGLKRRSRNTVLGFNIDPRSGYWAKDQDEDGDTEAPPDVMRPVRVVPIVRDRKNALLLRFRAPETFAPATLVTVQHALLRGIEVVFQLEEGEILGEPLPTRDDRRAILTYEATEGGAGVLSQLIEDDTNFERVARKALSIMHYDGVAEAVETGDPSLLTEREGEACVRGCYRCLLSYFNQPDHELIDRRTEEVRRLLVDLARGTTRPAADNIFGDPNPWLAAFASAQLPAPDARPVSFGDQEFAFVWRSHRVAASAALTAESARSEAAEKGWELFALEAADKLPVALRALLGAEG